MVYKNLKTDITVVSSASLFLANENSFGFVWDFSYNNGQQKMSEESESESSESECKCLTCNQKPTGSQFSLLHEPN